MMLMGMLVNLMHLAPPEFSIQVIHWYLSINTVTLPSSGGGGGSYTFDNGLSESLGTVKLDDALINNTSIVLDDNDLLIDGSSRVYFDL